jgi:hypothetical protein
MLIPETATSRKISLANAAAYHRRSPLEAKECYCYLGHCGDETGYLD